MTPTDLALALVEHWRQLELEPGSPVSPAAFAQLERSSRIELPDDMRAFYALADGLPSGAFDERAPLRIWPLADLTREADHPSWVRFADYLVYSHFYAIDLADPDHPIFLTGDPSPHLICLTFRRFLELMLTNDPTLWGAEAS